MTDTVSPAHSPVPSRRTILKTAAWAAPVIASSVVLPVAAASTTVDLSIIESGGDLVWAPSPDNLLWLETSATNSVRLTTTGAVPAPPGSTITFTYDNRLFGDLSVTALGTALASTPETTGGNRSTKVFTVPFEVPTEPATLDLVPDFGRRGTESDYFEDVESIVITVMPSVPELDSSNNTHTSAARYIETYDAAVTATYHEHTAPSQDPEFPVLWYTFDTITVASLAPGTLLAGGRLDVESPADATVDLVATSVTLDGVNAPGLFSAPTASNNRYSFELLEPIPAGSSATLTFQTTLRPEPVTTYPGTAYAAFSGDWVGDRDKSNDSVQMPQVQA